MTRVLLVGPMPPTKGGVTTFMLNLMASPLADEVRFLPFSTSRPPKTDVMENWGYRAMLRGGWRRVLSGAAVTAGHLIAFPLAVIGLRADLVQIQASDYQVFWEAALYAGIARLLGRPVLFRIGGAFDIFAGGAGPRQRRLIAAALRLPDVVIAQCAFAEGVIGGLGRQAGVVRLPNWIARMPPEPAREDDPPTCLFIAGLEAKRKGVGEVLEAMRLLRARSVRVRLLIVAATPGLQASLAALRLPEVTAEGPLPHTAVLARMQRCSIFLLPSHGEGFPNSLVEAMAAGMACIASAVGAVPEMAEGGGVIVVPPGDAAALAGSVAACAGSREYRTALGAAARRTVMARYTAQAALPPLLHAYRALAPSSASAERGAERRPAARGEGGIVGG